VHIRLLVFLGYPSSSKRFIVVKHVTRRPISYSHCILLHSCLVCRWPNSVPSLPNFHQPGILFLLLINECFNSFVLGVYIHIHAFKFDLICMFVLFLRITLTLFFPHFSFSFVRQLMRISGTAMIRRKTHTQKE
jgi:hypothetical protein